tara:strand:- start:312 stop:1229 length:918 start_codon:yes stop_codon:yes gene_type:complete
MLKKERLPFVEESVLLLGESGVGKSSLAKWIHENSKRAKEEFIQVNVASLSEQLFESEMFGHKKGSFTGAHTDKIGFCEKIGNGTLFLDEIGDLSLELQKKLLTLVDEKVFYSVGSTLKKIFRGQIIFATHKNLQKLVTRGKFREDLYYRICTFPFYMKPLRENPEKERIILNEFNSERIVQKKYQLKMTSSVRKFLFEYNFPGNFRELKQIIKYLVFVAENDVEILHFPHWVNVNKSQKSSSDDYYDALAYFERGFLVDKLKKYQGKINQTALKINISKVTLISKIKKYDINILHLKLDLMNGI